MHYGDPDGHDQSLWLECLREIERTPNAVVFGLGDYIDFTRTTYRPLLRATWGEDDNTHEEVDEMVTKQYVEPFVWLVRKHAPSMLSKPGKTGKLVGLIEGNHGWKFRDGTTSTQRICQLLGVRYLGLSAWIRLTVYRSIGKTKWGTGHNLNVLLNHSVSGSGNLPSSLAAATRKLQGWRGVDVFLSANDHQLGHSTEQQIGCVQSGAARPMEIQTIIGKVGSFQKGYNPGACSSAYVEKKFLHPSRLGYLAFDAWVHYKSLNQKERLTDSRNHSPEVWRYGNFSA